MIALLLACAGTTTPVVPQVYDIGTCGEVNCSNADSQEPQPDGATLCTWACAIDNDGLVSALEITFKRGENCDVTETDVWSEASDACGDAPVTCGGGS
jgi:hypothetical protein